VEYDWISPVENDWIKEIVAEAGTIEHSSRARRALHTGSEIVPVTPLCGRRARTRTTTTVVTVKPIRMSRAPASVDAESRVPATRM